MIFLSFNVYHVVSSSLIDCQGTAPRLAVVAEGGLSSSCPSQPSHFYAPER